MTMLYGVSCHHLCHLLCHQLLFRWYDGTFVSGDGGGRRRREWITVDGWIESYQLW